jgi:hypothetical protein
MNGEERESERIAIKVCVDFAYATRKCLRVESGMGSKFMRCLQCSKE